MWTRIVSLSAGLAVALYGAGLTAQQPACSKAGKGSLWSQTPWLRLEIVGGRLAVTSARCGSHRLTAGGAADSSITQSLLVQVQPGVVSAQYERLDEQSELTMTLDERERLTICRRGRDNVSVVEVRYEQPTGGPVILSIGSDQPRKYAAASLWHLLLTERDASREHLLPLLAQLRPDWRLDEQLAQMETELLARAGEDVLPVRHQWQSWVEQLASDRFAQRQAADRQLRAAGQPAVGYLRQLDLGGLDPEQRRRIAGLLASVACDDADSPGRAADWLLADKRVWLGLMSRGDVDQRIAAARHLAQLCGRSLAYDPAADAALRQAQLAALQAKLAEN